MPSMVEESFNTADQTRSFDYAQDDKKNSALKEQVTLNMIYYSIGWRMGAGEDYFFLNRLYFQCLSSDEQAYYKQKYPKPLAKRENET